MRINFNKFICSLSLVSVGAMANVGYVYDKNGVVVRDFHHKCWQTKDWNNDLAQASCDGSSAAKVSKVAPAATPVAVESKQEAVTKGEPIESLVHFDTNKSTLKKADISKLDKVATKLKNIPADKKIIVAGYSDPVGSNSYNQKLSLKRANEAKSFLVAKGVAPKQIEVEAEGESNLVTNLDSCKGKSGAALGDCLKADRRVDIYLR